MARWKYMQQDGSKGSESVESAQLLPAPVPAQPTPAVQAVPVTVPAPQETPSTRQQALLALDQFVLGAGSLDASSPSSSPTAAHGNVTAAQAPAAQAPAAKAKSAEPAELEQPVTPCTAPSNSTNSTTPPSDKALASGQKPCRRPTDGSLCDKGGAALPVASGVPARAARALDATLAAADFNVGKKPNTIDDRPPSLAGAAADVAVEAMSAAVGTPTGDLGRPAGPTRNEAAADASTGTAASHVGVAGVGAAALSAQAAGCGSRGEPSPTARPSFLKGRDAAAAKHAAPGSFLEALDGLSCLAFGGRKVPVVTDLGP